MSKKKSILVKPHVPPKADRSAKTTVKVATSNLFITSQKIDQTDAMTDAIIEDIGGQELINISRTDLLNGQNITYNVIENLASTQRSFNPNELIKLQSTSTDYFNTFQLDINNFIPDVGTETDPITGDYLGGIVYVDSDTGNVIINSLNVYQDLVLEVEFVSYSDIYSTSV